MLSDHQQQRYDAFYRSTHENQHLDKKPGRLVGLSATMGMN